MFFFINQFSEIKKINLKEKKRGEKKDENEKKKKKKSSENCSGRNTKEYPR